MQIFRVKKPLCKILKTKNCVPFEMQYTSSRKLFVEFAIKTHAQRPTYLVNAELKYLSVTLATGGLNAFYQIFASDYVVVKTQTPLSSSGYFQRLIIIQQLLFRNIIKVH